MTSGRALGFGSLDTEIDVDLPVEGTLPEWLSGTLLRNGPGSFAVGEDREVGHWFDGLAMLHRFAFDGGETGEASGHDGSGSVTYRNRFLRTDAYRAARAGEFDGGFATGETTLRERLKAFLFAEPYDNANIITERIGDRYLALTESPRWVEVDPGTLRTRGHVRYDGPEPSGQLACAHMQRDPRTDELVNFEIEFGRTSRYHVHSMRAPRDRTHVRSIAVEKPAYMHSFALTPSYVVLTEFPFVVDPLTILKPGRQGPFIEHFEWEPERGTRFVVVDRRRGRVVAAPRTDACFGFHHVNAYETDSGREIVIDVETVPDAAAVGALSLEDLREGPLEFFGGALDRFRVRPDEGTIERERLYAGSTALPTVSPARWLCEHRYVYAQGADQPMTDWPRTVLKIDTETRETREFSDGGNYLGEPIFVPRPETAEHGRRFADRPLGRSGRREPPEDDGVVLTVALDADVQHSWLLVLDGETLAERARAAVPHAIPFDFHGRYFPELTSN